MRIRISHETRYRYDAPTNGVIQTLRLTPRNHDGHYVIHWRIDVSEDCRLDVHEDAFGNITAPMASCSRMQDTHGPKLMFPRWAGLRLIQRTASARPMRMCVWRSGSITSARPRYAVPAAAAARKAWP